MKKFISSVFIIAALFSAITARAQQTDTVKTHNWFGHNIAGAAQIQLTYRRGNISQLNNALNQNGIPSINANELWINASMSHICHNWIMEDGIGFTPVATSSENNIDVKYNQYQAFFRAGYNVSQNSSFRLYPFAGINLSAAVLDIRDNNRIQSTSSFSDEILNSTSSKTFYQPNFGIELGAGFDYVIKMKPKKTDCFTIERNIPIGVRAGYYFNTYAGDWRINNYSLQNNGRNQKQNAVFVSFNIGLGYAVKK
ncbi:MAG: hypothetical protein JWQ84_3034 [Mucilaginibacter sp.]|nr:hypothetical protein [Mucilaginibacter sp.]